MPGRVTTAHERCVVIRVWPDQRLYLGADVDLVPAPLPQRLADDFLAVTVTVELRGVDEVNSAAVRVQKGADRRRVVDLAPLAAELPAAKRNLANLPAGCAEVAILQCAGPSTFWCTTGSPHYPPPPPPA